MQKLLFLFVMALIEIKSPDKAFPLLQIIEKKMSQQQGSISEDQGWVAYVNDRLCLNWKKVIRPRSKIVLLKKAENAPAVQIVFESKELVVLNKPEDLPTQKTLKKNEDNLYDQVREYYLHQKRYPQGLPYVGLHHRLDRMTSGLVLMTKQRSANKEVSDLFKNKTIKKEYLAYCVFDENMNKKKWTERNNIARGFHKRHPFYFSVADQGDEAVTVFDTLETLKGEWHKIKCMPQTGRTHQLRVQLSHLGIPIIGDPVYGRKKHQGLRLMLHARKLSFLFKGQRVEAEVEPTWTLPSQT